MLAGVSIIAIVFLPLLTLQGLEGKLFAPVALTIVLALSASVLIAFTVVPALASLLLRSHASDTPWLMRKLSGGFAWLQAWSLAHRRTVFGIALATLAGAAPCICQWERPYANHGRGRSHRAAAKAPSISLTASLDMDQRVQQALLEGVPKSAPSWRARARTIWAGSHGPQRDRHFSCAQATCCGAAARKILQMPSAA
jgi:HME family heavy-metal exporter/cobalt-zinc-cadmium resistance protein CzcA